MITLVALILATISTILFLIFLEKGKKYSEIYDSASKDDFPLQEFYGVGFMWQEKLHTLSYEGRFADMIRSDIVIYYGEKYCEYYCRMILAQVYTYVHLCICFFCLLACFVDDITCLVIVAIGFIMGYAIGDYYLKHVSAMLKERAEDCVIEFPNMVTKLSLMISSGMILREAWETAGQSTKGVLHNLILESCEEMKNGISESEAFHRFGVRSNSKEMKKFAAELIQGMERGNFELAAVLIQQSSELWELKRQKMLQKGEQAATKLVIPTTIMFGGLLLVIVSSAISGMSI